MLPLLVLLPSILLPPQGPLPAAVALLLVLRSPSADTQHSALPAFHRIQYAEEVPEWQMEKNRYYVELPGDVWEEGELMRLIKDNQEKRVRGLGFGFGWVVEWVMLPMSWLARQFMADVGNQAHVCRVHMHVCIAVWLSTIAYAAPAAVGAIVPAAVDAVAPPPACARCPSAATHMKPAHSSLSVPVRCLLPCCCYPAHSVFVSARCPSPGHD